MKSCARSSVCYWSPSAPILPGRTAEPCRFGLALAVLGQVFRIYAAGYIFKNKQLATTGPYALVRHPLYLGNFIILIGFTIASANLYVVAGVIVFFLVWYPAAIAYEDSKLENIFGDEWRAWSRNIRAIIPGRVRWSDLKASGWDTYQSLIRNGELPISLYLVELWNLVVGCESRLLVTDTELW